jgi:hypothetical protein
MSLRGGPLFVSYGYRDMSLFTYALTKGEFLNDYETLPLSRTVPVGLLRFFSPRRSTSPFQFPIARCGTDGRESYDWRAEANFDSAATISSA